MKQVIFGILAAAALSVAAWAYDAARHVRPAEAVLAQATQAVAEQAVSGYETVAVVGVRQVCERDVLAEVEIALTALAGERNDKARAAVEAAIRPGCEFAGVQVNALNVLRGNGEELADGLESYARPAPYRTVRLVSIETPTPFSLQVQAEAQAGWFRRAIQATGTAEYTPVEQERIVAWLAKAGAEIEAEQGREVVVVEVAEAPVPVERPAGAGENAEPEPIEKTVTPVQPRPAPTPGQVWTVPADQPILPTWRDGP